MRRTRARRFARELLRYEPGLQNMGVESSAKSAAFAHGVLFGRPRKLTPHQAREALRRVNAGEPLREIALSFNVDHSTISRLKARHAAV